eukprot:12651248-Alexandrium_andersonii.AAC.1
MATITSLELRGGSFLCETLNNYPSLWHRLWTLNVGTRGSCYQPVERDTCRGHARSHAVGALFGLPCRGPCQHDQRMSGDDGVSETGLRVGS